MRKIQTHYGAKITLPKCAFTHGDNAFDCWTTNKDGSGKAYRDEAEITVDQISMSLYAQWKGLEAKVTFKPGSGGGGQNGPDHRHDPRRARAAGLRLYKEGLCLYRLDGRDQGGSCPRRQDQGHA